MDEKHEHDADEQCDKSRIKRHPEALSDAGDVPLYCLVCLA